MKSYLSHLMKMHHKALALFCALGCSQPAVIAQFSVPHAVYYSALGGGSRESGDMDGDGTSDIPGGIFADGYYANPANTGIFEWRLFSDGTVPGSYTPVCLLDVDADGLRDVVYDARWWRRNLGEGDYTQPMAFPAYVPNGSTDVLYAMDIDDDGDEDLVITKQPQNMSVVLNLGLGQWADAVTIAVVNTTFPPERFVIDASGREAILSAYNGTLRWFLGQVTGEIELEYEMPEISRTFAVDIDGDGSDDLVYGEGFSGIVFWRRNLGQWTFAAAEILYTGTPLTGGLPFGEVEKGDLNGDGFDDIVVLEPDNDIQVLFGQGGGLYAPAEVIEPNLHAIDLVVENVDGDPSAEILCDTHGFGGLDLVLQVNTDGEAHYETYLDEPYEQGRYLHAADFDDDGDVDVLRVRRRFGGYYDLVLYKSNAGQGFETGLYILRKIQYAAVDVADMDADGDDDILTIGDSLSIWLNDGNGTFSKMDVLSTSSNVWYHIKAQDLDGDGDMDLACAVNSSIVRYQNTGGLGFTSAGATDIGFGNSARISGIWDYDDDGDLDILSRTSWLQNNGSMSFTGVGYGASVDLEFADTADVDLDGDVDIVFSSNELPGDQAFLFEHLNGSNYADPVALVDGSFGACRPRLMDVDGDGDKDIVVLLPGTASFIKTNDGSGAWGAPIPLSNFDLGFVNSDVYSAPFDMDLDGDDDLLYFIEALGTLTQGYGLAWSENYAADPYHLSGTVYADLNNDGEPSIDEPGIGGASITAEPAAYVSIGGADGAYLIHSSAGLQTVAVELGPFWELSSAPAQYVVTPSASEPDWPGLDFGFIPIVDTTLVHAELTEASGPCSAETSLWATFTNLGTRVEHGEATLVIDGMYEYVGASPTPVSIVGNTITWLFDSLSYGSTAIMHVVVSTPSASSIGGSVDHQLTVTTLDDIGASTGTFSAELTGVVTCSFDPNDKLVTPVGYGVHGAVDIGTEELTYTVRFQNTGNAPAENIVIRDDLDATLVPGSLRLLSFSHEPISAAIQSGNQLVVTFLGINLPDSASDFTGSQGFIKFVISLAPGSAHETHLTNHAEIFFDLNEPVVTNTVPTTLVDCALWQPTITSLPGGLLVASEGDAYQWYHDGLLVQGASSQSYSPGSTGLFSVMVTSIYGCEEVSSSIVFTLVNDHPYEDDLSIYLVPNPFSDVAQLFVSTASPVDLKVTIVDMNGRVAYSVAGSSRKSVTIDRRTLSAGLYLVVVNDSTGKTRRTIRMAVE